MVDCPYCGAENHVESEEIRDEFETVCGSCDKTMVVYLDWSLSAEKLPAPEGRDDD